MLVPHLSIDFNYKYFLYNMKTVDNIEIESVYIKITKYIFICITKYSNQDIVENYLLLHKGFILYGNMKNPIKYDNIIKLIKDVEYENNKILTE